jgi:hypothetical protein
MNRISPSWITLSPQQWPEDDLFTLAQRPATTVESPAAIPAAPRSYDLGASTDGYVLSGKSFDPIGGGPLRWFDNPANRATALSNRGRIPGMAGNADWMDTGGQVMPFQLRRDVARPVKSAVAQWQPGQDLSQRVHEALWLGLGLHDGITTPRAGAFAGAIDDYARSKAG